MENKNLEPIAIIGMGAIMPGANDKETFWNNILNKKNCITEVPKTHWDINVFYDPDHKAKDKTYSKIGGFIRDFKFDPIKHRIPPQIAAQMDSVQHLAIETAVMAMNDAGYDKKPFNRERTAVIIGNSMGGMKKEETDLRVYRQTYFDMIRKTSTYARMGSAGNALLAELDAESDRRWAPINEDTMPGELSNVIAGRVANVLNVNAANFTVDAACATSLAAVYSAINGLRLGHFDMCVCGGVDQMMSASAYIKFCKIGALSEDGSWVFDARANGFVMAEGAGMILLKRLSDAVRDGDRIYSLVRAIGASSDGKGKGITAPNPKGQRIAIAKTFEQLDYTPADIGLMEAHGTATRVGDVTELNSTGEAFAQYVDKKGSIGIGSVKSMMGHAKAAAGIASIIKTSFAIHNKVMPPSMNFETPNPDIDWKNSPFRVLTQAEEWSSKGPRRANVSSFGFGGTNFHAALEEFDPKATRTPEPRYMKEEMPRQLAPKAEATLKVGPEKLQSETLTFSAIGKAELINEVRLFAQNFSASDPYPLILEAYKRHIAPRGAYGVTIVAENPVKLKDKIAFFIKTASAEDVWEKGSLHLKMKGIYPFRPQTYGGKVGFMFPGQGSQYVDMMKDLASKYQVVQDTFDEADRILKGLIDTTLTEVIWSKPGESAEQLAKREEAIKQTQMTQPAVLTADIAMFRLLGTFGLKPDVSIGHSLGEYAAAVAAGVFTFENGLRAVTNRAKEMSSIKVEDPGKMASIAAPCERVEPELKKIKGYVVAANKNCPSQTVIAGEKQSIDEAIKMFTALGIQAVEIPVSHAFHSEIIRDAVEPYRRFLTTLPIASPKLPLLSNVTADYFPSDPDAVRTLLVKQITSTVEWIRQLERMYADGVRIFVECGPKRVLSAFATSTLANKKDIFILSSNHPKKGGIVEFNDLLANMTASSIKIEWNGKDPLVRPNDYNPGFQAWVDGFTGGAKTQETPAAAETPAVQGGYERFGFNTNPIAISGIAAGVPGSWDKAFRDSGIDEILAGKNLIEPISPEDQQKQIDKNVVYVVKSATGDHRIERLTSISQAIKLAARKGGFDLEREFGLPANWVESMDTSFRMAIAAGIKALHDAGIPLVQSYKKTSTGKYLPEKWTLPAEMSDETGVIFASAFPTTDNLIREISRSLTAKYRNAARADIYKVYEEIIQKITDAALRRELSEWFAANFNKYHSKGEGEQFSQNFLLKIIPIGHSQFCQWIRARGPATHVSAACSTTTQAVGIAEDWIRTGRAKRVIVIGGDDITNENAHEWVMAGFLASGAATTKAEISEAALPFDRRRHGLIVGVGAIGIVLEDETCTRARGMKPLARLLGTVIANSAFHPTRLDVTHVADVMDNFIGRIEKRHGLNRSEIARNMLFMSHETYTPARGGSASAEVNALRQTFGRDVMNVVVSNVKGFTGHTMGASLEDVVAVRALNTGIVPPIANYKEPDPELAGINLSKGGKYDLRYALRLGAGFGSQLAMSFTERTYKAGEARIENPSAYQNWLKSISGQSNPELEVVNNTLRVKDIFDPSADAAPPVVMEAPQAFVTTPKQASVSIPAARKPEQKPASYTAAKPVPAPVVPKPAQHDEDSIKETIIELVTQKTGYPKDMLDIDLDMEADLGIDTVKQAELFAGIREHYNIPRRDGVKLKDYPTIRHCIKFVTSEIGGVAATEPAPKPQPVAAHKIEVPAPAPAPKAAAPAKSALSEESVKTAILELVTQKTGYPKDMLDIDLDMEADLGIDTVKQAELFAAMRDAYNIPRKDGVKLKDYPTIRHCINFVMTEAGNPSAAPVAEAPAAQPAPAAHKVEATKPAPAPAPAPKAETPKAAVASQAASLNEESVKTAILDMISSKTGYPKDMLDIDLDMEADLGIDTVKQAELFAAMRDAYNIPRKDGVKLKDYPTIRHCINFVMTEAGSPSAAPVAEAPSAQPAPVAHAEEPAASVATAFVRKETRNLRHVPIVVDAPLAVREDRKLSHDRPVLIFSDNAAMARAFQAELSSLKVKSHIFTSLKTRSKNATVVNWKDLNDVEAALKEYALGNPNVQGFIYLLGCTDKKLDRKANAHDDLVRYVMPLFVACKVFEKDLANRADADTFINVCMTHDGGFGYYGDRQFDPIYGALAGTMRCLRKDMYELTKCFSKLQDFEPAEGPEYISKTAMEELLHGDGVLDIAWGGRKRQTYHALPEKLDVSKELYDLRGKTVLVTGGGRGLGAMFAKAVSERYRSNFVIFDIIPVTAKTAEYAAMSTDELKTVKAKLWETMKADTTKKATPVMLEREYTRILDSITLYKNLEALKALGSKVDYHVCDVTDRKAMADTLASIKSAHGRLDGVVHFAGLERSKLVNEKTIEEFFKIYDVKAQSAMDLLASDIVKDSGFWLFISSIAGKFGNLGQSDYAAASDYTSKLAISLTNSGTRAIAIDMSAYAAVGMGARPGVEAFLKSQGLDFIQPDEGIQALVDEIVYGEVPEYVLTSTLDKLDWDRQVHIDHNPAPGKVKGNRKGGNGNEGGASGGGEEPPSGEEGPVRPFVSQMTSDGKAMRAEKVFSLESDYYLRDHAISGTPYVPGVMGIETFMEAAAAASGKAPAGLEDVRFMLPIKLLRNKPQKVKITAEKTAPGKLDMAIESDFLNPQGIKLGNPRKHFAARTVDSADSKWATVVKPNLGTLPAPVADSEQIYKVYFHGPSFQVLESVLAIDDQRVLAVYKRPAVYQWKDGGKRDLLAYPMLIEAAFQACGYRDLHRDNVMALPDNVGRVLVYNHGEAPEKLFILGIYKGKDEMGKSIYDAFVFGGDNKLWVELEDYRMIPQ